MTDELFEKWYQHYPNKVGRGAARKAFAKINPSEGLVEVMIRAVQKQTRMRQEARANKQFLPDWKNPATWLNQECWTDEAPVYGPQTKIESKLCDCGNKAFMTDGSPIGRPICSGCYVKQFSPPAIVQMSDEQKRVLWQMIKQKYPKLAQMMRERKSGQKSNANPHPSQTG